MTYKKLEESVIDIGTTQISHLEYLKDVTLADANEQLQNIQF